MESSPTNPESLENKDGSKSGQFPCDRCNKSFTRKYNLRLHIKSHDGVLKVKAFKCEVCGRAFAQRYDLTHHMRIHTGEKPFKCEQCLKSFTLSKTLKKHIATHSNKKDHQCEHCDKTYFSSLELKNHKKSCSVFHKKAFLQKCSICFEEFPNRPELMEHHKTKHNRIFQL